MRFRNAVVAFALVLLAATVAPDAQAEGKDSTVGNRIAGVVEFVLDVLGLNEEPTNEIGPEINPVG